LDLDEEFERDLRKVIELEPDNAHALNALGYFLVDRGKRLDEAEKYLTQAIALLPEDPAIIDSLGWLNYRKGNYDEALVLLRKAFGKLLDPEIAAHLGEVLWVTGDEKSATEIWNKGLEVTPDDGLLRGVMERYIQ
jgi:Flp pilus assembly protein TadD